MTSIRLPRLSKTDVIRSVSPARLTELIAPYADYLTAKGIEITLHDDDHIERLINGLQHPECETPNELLDAFCMIDEMASSVAIEGLLHEVSLAELGLSTKGTHSAADIATAAWLTNRDRLLRAHAKGRLKRPRSFDYFQTSLASPPVFRIPSESVIREMETELDNSFELRGRGRGTRIEIFADQYERRSFIWSSIKTKYYDFLFGFVVRNVGGQPPNPRDFWRHGDGVQLLLIHPLRSVRIAASGET